MQFKIYTVNLDPTIGAEIKKTRPCVIVSPDEMNLSLRTVIVVPLTTKNRPLPTRVLIKSSSSSGLASDSYAAIDQVKTIDKLRLGASVGEISEKEKNAVSAVLVEMFKR